MPASGEKTLFEYLQSDLDTVTEELSRLVEAEGKPEKMATIQKAADARMRLRHFRDGVDNGASRDSTAPTDPSLAPLPPFSWPSR